MNPDQRNLVQKADESLRAARVLLQEGFTDFAAARAYYTMFYVAQAFLLKRGLSFSKHSAVIAAFGREFAKTNQLPREYHRYLIDAQEVRLIADYRGSSINAQEASLQIERAKSFLDLANQHLDRK